VTFTNTNTGCSVSGVRITGFTHASGKGISIGGSSDYVQVLGNDLRGNTTALSGSATNQEVANNLGYVTGNKGSATILDTTSTIVVTHGLTTTPTSVTVSPRANEAVWVSARTSTTFTVSRVGTTPALVVDWQAEL
jgi:hypothetical protein